VPVHQGLLCGQRWCAQSKKSAQACSLRAMNRSTKVQSSQANSRLYASGAGRVHPVIVGWSTRNRPSCPGPSMMFARCRMASRSSRRNWVVVP
jgi:hypothetical protein